MAIYQKLADDNPAVTDFRSDLADSHINLGNLLSETGKPRRRRPSTARRWRSTRSWPTTTPPSPTSAQPGGSHDNLGNLLCTRASRRRRRPSSARRWRSSRSWPTTTPPSPISAAAWRIATSPWLLLSETGKPAEAEAECRKALAIRQKLADDNPAVTEFRTRLAHSHYNLGDLLSKTGKPAEAEAEFRKAMALHQKLADDDPAITDFRDSWRGATTTSPSAVEHGQAGGGGGRVPQGDCDPAEAGRRQPRRHRLPRAAGGQPQQPRHPAVGRRASRPRRRPSSARRLAIRQKLAADNPAVTEFRSEPGGQPLQPRRSCCRTRASRRRRRPSTARDGDPAEAGRRQPLVIDLRDGLFFGSLRVAALQAWFGQDKELSSTCEKLLSLAKDTEDPGVADKAAKCCSLRRADAMRHEPRWFSPVVRWILARVITCFL